jgi:23S rRNA (adenine-N6)-dimethyltransferase
VAVGRARGAPPPRRRHAQHFLRSTRLAARIVRDADLCRDDLVLEIGAGTGTLTAELARSCGRVRAVEIDAGLVARLRERFARTPEVEIVHADALDVPLPGEPFRVVANIPFAVGAAICRRLLDDPLVPLERADLIVELGVAQKRARVSPSTALGVYWGAWYEFAVVRRLDASAFAPPPSVDAAVLRIVRRAEPLVPRAAAVDYKALVTASFVRRTVVRRALGGVVSPRQLKRLAGELGFAPDAYPWELDQHQWAGIFGFVRPGPLHSKRHEPL